MTAENVELRCPVGPKRLLAIMRRNGEKPVVTRDNLIEFACPDCRRLRRRDGLDLHRVLHRFDLAGELIETLEVRPSSGP